VSGSRSGNVNEASVVSCEEATVAVCPNHVFFGWLGGTEMGSGSPTLSLSAATNTAIIGSTWPTDKPLSANVLVTVQAG